VESLGTRTSTDVLSISLSSTDLVGHAFGPDSPQIHDLNLNMDRQLGGFLQYLDKRFRPGGVLVILTADHGVSPLPEVQAQRRMPGGRLTDAALRKPVEAALNARFGDGKWVLAVSSGSFWLDRAAIQEKKLEPADVERCAAEALAGQAHVMRVYTRTQLLLGQVGDDLIGRRVYNGFFPSRSADVIGVLEPYWIYGARDASHGTPYSYDTHMPLIFMGPGIRPGYYDMPVAINDIAPTLATILEVETPSGSTGRTLYEMLAPATPMTAPRPPAPPVKK
jgi:arylsulfatase A-like enzyme